MAILFPLLIRSASIRANLRLQKHFFVPFEEKPGQDALAQLKADGVDPADVKTVIISHLHLDHTGAIDGFPNAEILVDKRGRTLYLFARDRHGKSSCSGACAGYWPALTTKGKPKAISGAREALLGSFGPLAQLGQVNTEHQAPASKNTRLEKITPAKIENLVHLPPP